MRGIHSLASRRTCELRARVLVADDDPITRALVRGRLETMGADVFEAEDGVDALHTLSSEAVDLLVVDVEMPNMNGLELIGCVRGHPQLQHLPVIVFTGSESRSSMETALSVGATSFLLKPLNWTAFGNHIRHILELVTRGRTFAPAESVRSPA